MCRPATRGLVIFSMVPRALEGMDDIDGMDAMDEAFVHAVFECARGEESEK